MFEAGNQKKPSLVPQRCSRSQKGCRTSAGNLETFAINQGIRADEPVTCLFAPGASTSHQLVASSYSPV